MPPEPHKRFAFLLLLLIVCFSQLTAQLKPADALNKLYTDFPQEKIYTWLNKPAFIAGETAWFKVYVFSGYDLSHISSNIYVELLSGEKRSLGIKRYPLMKGSAYGSFVLDSALHEDVYYLRVFTDWMLNFDEQFQYIKPIPVYNPSSKFKLEQVKDQWEVGICPEGGSLIDGLETIVGVRLTSPGSLPTKWEGRVIDDERKKISDLVVLDTNVAVFIINPAAGRKYKVVVADGKGETKTADLPEVKSSGALMNVTSTGDTVAVTLRFKDVPGNGYSLIGHIQNELVYEAHIKSSSSVIRQTINTKNYLNGILHLTLFTPDKKPVAERLIFMNPSKLVFDTTILAGLALNNSPRSKNELTITLDSANWNSYAVEIFDDDLPQDRNNESLLSSLWFTSDITTSIYNAASFFDAPDEKKIKALDAILITEKWKRFNWEKILSGQFPEIKYKPQNFLTYAGVIKSKKEIGPNEGISLLLGNPGAPTQMVFTTCDSSQRINVDNILFMGDFYSYYRLNNGKKYAGRKIDIDFSRLDNYEPYQSPLPANGYKLTLSNETNNQPGWVHHNYEILKAQKANDARFKTLREVIVRSTLKTKKEQLHDKLATGRFKISNENIFDFVNEKQSGLGMPTLFHWLQGRVNGLEAIYNPRDFEWTPVYRRFSRSAIQTQVLLYLNEGETTASWLNFVPLDNIIMVKVITAPRTLAFGHNVALVISVYTERDSIVPAYREIEFRNQMLKGYDIPAVYPMPQYDNPELVFPEKDARSELLWQPMIAPQDSLYNSRIRFFNNDSVKNLRIIIQGFNNEGFPVYINKLIRPDAIKPF